MAYATVTLSGAYQTPDGTPHKGHVEIIPSERVIKDTTGDVILTGRVKVELDAQGAFTVALPATDDPTLNPTGFGYTIAAKLHSSHPPAVSFSLPAALVATTVEDLTPVDPATFNPAATFYTAAEVDTLIVTDHGTLTGLTDDDHTQYALADGTRGNFAPTAHTHPTTEVTGLATVATTGNYSDLTGQPTIPATAADVGALPDTTTPADIGAVAYGPAPSGSDDAAAIQAAIDATAPGGVVRLPVGDFLIGTTVRLKTGVSIQGAGWGATTLTATADVAVLGSEVITGPTTPTTTVRDASIRSLTVTGYGTNGTTSSCIALDGSTDVLIEDVHADSGSLAGIYVEDSTRVTIRNCRVTNNKGGTYPAIDIVRSTNCLVEGCTTEGGSWVCVGINASTGCTVAHNTLRGNHSGVNVFGAAHRNRIIGNDCSTTGSGVVIDGDTGTANHNLVDGNTCHGSNTRGIFINNALDTSVTGNVATGNMQNAGIYVVNSPRTQITGNTSVGNTGHGINLVSASHDCVITGNLVRGNTSDGISLSGILRCAVTGNVVRSNGNHGISSSGGGAYNTITGNTSSENGAGYSGVLVGSSRHVITGNLCNGSGAGGQGYGIRVTGGTNNLVVGNLCYQNATNNLLDAGTTTTVANNVTT